MLRTSLCTLLLLACCTGCETLGLSLYPQGSFLTRSAAEVLEQAPRRTNMARELNKTVLDTHYLQPGDTLLLEPVDLDSELRFPSDQKVMVDGTIDLGGYGRVVVAGLTLEGAEELIVQTIMSQVDAAAEPEQSYEVNARLLEPVHRYYVLGAVASPGSYPLTGYETVLDAILEAGGLTSDASPCNILLARPTQPNSCRAVVPICYRQITQLGDTTTNYQLRPGDRIFVASRSCTEELLFWTASNDCAKCCDQHVACCDPAGVGYSNPITMLPHTWLSNLLPGKHSPAPTKAADAPSSAPQPQLNSGDSTPPTPQADGQLQFEEEIPSVQIPSGPAQ